MSRTELLAGLLLAGCCSAAAAMTFDQLAEKNARFIELKVDLAIAKAESDLADQRNRAQGATLAGKVPAIEILSAKGGVPVPLAPPAAVRLAPAEKPAPVPGADIFLNSVHGKAGRYAADFQHNGTALSRRVGEIIFDGWQVSAIAYPEVTLVKRAAAPAQKDSCKRLTIGISIAQAPNCP